MPLISAQAASLVARVAAALDMLRTWPWFDTLRMLRQRFGEDRLGLTASSLTFTTLIALVPLVTVMLAAFSIFPMFGDFQQALETYFLQSLVPDNIARPVLQALTQFAAKASQMGGVGLVLLVATALSVVLTIDRTLNAIWRVRTPRSIAQRLLVYWTGLTLGPLALGVSLWLASLAMGSGGGVFGQLPGGLDLLLDALKFALLATAMAGLFHYVPNTAVRWRHAWAGGLFVAAGFELAKQALAWYVSAVPSFSIIYGAFATVPILLLWIYLGWVIVLLGAVVAAYAPSLQMRVVRRAHTPGYRFELALELLRPLARARGDTERGLTLEALSQQLRVDPLQIEPVLEDLVAIDWVAALAEGNVPRHVLLVDPRTAPVAPLVARLLLAPGPATQAFSTRAGFPSMTLADLLGMPGPTGASVKAV